MITAVYEGEDEEGEEGDEEGGEGEEGKNLHVLWSRLLAKSK